MDELIMLEWDNLQPLSQQIPQFISSDNFFKDQSLSTNCYNASNTDQFVFSHNDWDAQNKNSIASQSNSIYKGLIEERNATIGYDMRHLQGGKMVNKGIVPPNNDHIIAERKRREKLNQRFVELSSIIPCLRKTDKASILIGAAKYVKELEHKVKTLESQNSKPIVSKMLVKASSFSSKIDHGHSSYTELLPRIDARFLENSMLINIHCENSKGVLVKILSEIEELNFSVTHTNLIPFPDCTVFITLTAQIEEGNDMSAENVMQKLKLALNQFRSRNPNS